MNKRDKTLMAEWDAGFKAGWESAERKQKYHGWFTTLTSNFSEPKSADVEIISSMDLMCQIMAEKRPWNKPIAERGKGKS